MPIHHSALSRTFVKMIGRLGRWKRVLNARAIVRTNTCADTSSLELDMLTVGGGVDDYLSRVGARTASSTTTQHSPACSQGCDSSAGRCVIICATSVIFPPLLLLMNLPRTLSMSPVSRIFLIWTAWLWRKLIRTQSQLPMRILSLWTALLRLGRHQRILLVYLSLLANFHFSLHRDKHRGNSM